MLNLLAKFELDVHFYCLTSPFISWLVILKASYINNFFVFNNYIYYMEVTDRSSGIINVIIVKSEKIFQEEGKQVFKGKSSFWRKFFPYGWGCFRTHILLGEGEEFNFFKTTIASLRLVSLFKHFNCGGYFCMRFSRGGGV